VGINGEAFNAAGAGAAVQNLIDGTAILWYNLIVRVVAQELDEPEGAAVTEPWHRFPAYYI